MNPRNKNCKKLENKAFMEQGVALKDWRMHAEKCADCQSRLVIIEKLERAGNCFNTSLGDDRFAIISKAVSERKKQAPYSLIFKYAALLFFLLICFFIFRSIAPKEEQTILLNEKSKPAKEEIELAWDYVVYTDSLRFKIRKLKRKVYFGDLRNDNLSSFKLKCRSIRKQTYKLKNAKQI